MSSSKYRYVSLCLLASLGLGACMEGGSGVASRDSADASASAERDVEDPRVFSRRENGLWDGRPSFGGVWVAHPDARTPERVIIRNTENGREAVGSLFTRERMNPGPPFQVSGEAATAVGILAGAPTMLEVVALRVEEPTPVPAVETAEETLSEPAPQVATAPTETAPTPEPDSAGETLIAMPEEVEEPRRPGLFGRVFGRRDTQPSANDQIEATPLEPSEMAQATAPTAAPPAPTSTPTPMPTPASAPAATQAPTSTLERPYIQLGIFSVEANARNAERMARGADLPARVVSGSAQGNSFWRVVVGPASDAASQRQMLARVKALGFNDAYTVRR